MTRLYGGNSLKDVSPANEPPSTRPLLALLPYLWPADRPDLKGRVMVCVVLLILAKIITVAVPFFFGWAIDHLSGDPATLALAVPIALIVSYGIARILMQAFAQIRDAVFAKVAYHALRQIAVET